MNDETKLEPKRNSNPFQIDKIKESNAKWNPKGARSGLGSKNGSRRRLVVWVPAPWNRFWEPLRRIFLGTININQYKKRKSDVPEGVSKKHEIVIKCRCEKVTFWEA